jgi:hypothetical protein
MGRMQAIHDRDAAGAQPVRDAILLLEPRGQRQVIRFEEAVGPAAGATEAAAL